jgi:hypothetical protein
MLRPVVKEKPSVIAGFSVTELQCRVAIRFPQSDIRYTLQRRNTPIDEKFFRNVSGNPNRVIPFFAARFVFSVFGSSPLRRREIVSVCAALTLIATR